MKLQFVTVPEAGASELLPLSSGTLRVFLIVGETSADGDPRPSSARRPSLRAPWDTVRPYPRGGLQAL